MGSSKKKLTSNNLIYYVVDIITIIVSFGICMLLNGPDTYLSNIFTPIYILCACIVFIGLNQLLGLYKGLWQYATLIDLVKIIISCLIFYGLNVVAVIFSKGIEEYSFSFAFEFSFIAFGGTCFTRLYQRLIKTIKAYGPIANKNVTRKSTMVIGAGDAGCMIIKELLESPLTNLYPTCIIDDDKEKIGHTIFGINVVGSREDILMACKKFEVSTILIAMPAAPANVKRDIINICKETGCNIQILPGMFELINGTVSVSNFRNVEIKDLLGREQIKVDLAEITAFINNKVVLVTGGGGSIGSELCRQIAKNDPKQLIIVDIYENNAYDIEQELKHNYPNLNLVVLIASIRDNNRVESIFDKYHPEIVFNAAAHKHVPLMETSPHEAIKNNVFGTLNVAKACDKYHVKRMVQISTDKAVNPTNIMGASKRLCEMIIQTMDQLSQNCEYVAVRFGNVLGSNGSVIPLFKKQIAAGGPLTVTHKDIIRYFMTIPEAVSLVLEAGSNALGGEIFVLDMGEPVKIYDLAVNLIKLSGYTPGVNMDIKITGLRPGEKLYEERLMAEEGLTKTANGLISVAKPLEINVEEFYKNLDNLYQIAYDEDANMIEAVEKIVPTFKHVN